MCMNTPTQAFSSVVGEVNGAAKQCFNVSLEICDTCFVCCFFSQFVVSL